MGSLIKKTIVFTCVAVLTACGGGGGGGNTGIHQKLIQFIDSSVFVVKNYSVKKKYKILLPVNDSKGSDMAIETAINKINNKIIFFKL